MERSFKLRAAESIIIINNVPNTYFNFLVQISRYCTYRLRLRIYSFFFPIAFFFFVFLT